MTAAQRRNQAEAERVIYDAIRVAPEAAAEIVAGAIIAALGAEQAEQIANVIGREAHLAGRIGQ
jgi:hypothetical protein